MSNKPDDPMVLTSVPTEAEASAIVLALTDYGIEAQSAGGFTAGFRAESPGEVQVVVKTIDFARAETALEAIRQGDSDVDWSQVDVGDPEE